MNHIVVKRNRCTPSLVFGATREVEFSVYLNAVIHVVADLFLDLLKFVALLPDVMQELQRFVVLL